MKASAGKREAGHRILSISPKNHQLNDPGQFRSNRFLIYPSIVRFFTFGHWLQRADVQANRFVSPV